jgi:hypothetical protein
MRQRESITYADPTALAILLTIPGMETHTEGSQSAIDFLSPTAGWEAAARWNRATFDWVAKGWQQWVALMTTVPPQFIAPSARDASVAPAPAVVHVERATAAGSKRPARKVSPKAKSGKATKTRSRA